MEIPAHIERSLSRAVAHHLEAELSGRGLLLTTEDLAAAEAEASRRGAYLRGCVMHQCYPIIGQGRGVLEFADRHTAARLDSALAFGAVTARVLAKRDVEPFAAVELLCAAFNLGIGLIDAVCDDDAETGGALLEFVEGSDLADASAAPRARGWLRSALPPGFVDDSTVAFAADIIEAFFEMLHAVYPGDGWLRQRRRVGSQLGAALEAERQSVIRSAGHAARGDLIEYSRLTSVLPFQIIETLANGDRMPEPTAGTRLGEALWRIDDLVDLCQDARRGALNGVLLAATPGSNQPADRDLLVALERLIESTDIAETAADAAETLLRGLQLAGDDHRAAVSFLHFIQRYAGLPALRAS